MLSEALRLIRVFNDMRLSDLAKALNVSPSYISEIESGKKKPSLELIEKYANLFKTSQSSILFFAEETEKVHKKKLKSAIKKNLINFLKIIEGLLIDEK